MHELKRNPLRAVVAIFVLTALSLTPAIACERLWVADRELWVADGDEVRLIASDARGIEHPVWSPRGDRVVYAHELAADLTIVNRKGETVRSLPLGEDVPVTAILSIGWRGEQRVFAIGHVNPSTSMYLEWDADSGRMVESIPGTFFTISADGRSLAYRENVPHGAPPPHDSAVLMIDGRAVWPPAGDESYHRFSGGPAWSSDGRVAILDRTADATALVTIDARRNAASRVTLPAPIAGELSWTPAGAVSIRAHDELWLVEPATGKSDRMERPATESIRAPDALRERMPRANLRAGATRCNG